MRGVGEAGAELQRLVCSHVRVWGLVCVCVWMYMFHAANKIFHL